MNQKSFFEKVITGNIYIIVLSLLIYAMRLIIRKMFWKRNIFYKIIGKRFRRKKFDIKKDDYKDLAGKLIEKIVNIYKIELLKSKNEEKNINDGGCEPGDNINALIDNNDINITLKNILNTELNDDSNKTESEDFNNFMLDFENEKTKCDMKSDECDTKMNEFAYFYKNHIIASKLDIKTRCINMIKYVKAREKEANETKPNCQISYSKLLSKVFFT
ncbi:hypothetical protein EDEG_01788 [Edhazardia aedis USNM 41457]|uniref:Uncharacterized protein n=1 Tax=Edhazardia aedis (strain USNM 41457) TaxID=1003232 RepID=J9D803_EDHAE|nr:hypothetical protein EDEG_01788 [Edhazardia aedis USNM 41457]|eukprot:EJW03921.1 hypothetical protein EDEG_01788 [Edhazardia aedis USNM 41457]